MGPPRQKAELRQGALVALVVHALLFAALSFNIPWTPPPPTVVAAELWSAVPQSAPLPAAAEPEPVAVEPPPAKVAAPEPPVAPPQPQVPDAQIALEKEKKAKEERAEMMSLIIKAEADRTEMKKNIEDSLINEGKRYMLPELEKIFPKFHIHGLTSHEILYPTDPSNSSHCRGDGKIFICTHC